MSNIDLESRLSAKRPRLLHDFRENIRAELGRLETKRHWQQCTQPQCTKLPRNRLTSYILVGSCCFLLGVFATVSLQSNDQAVKQAKPAASKSVATTSIPVEDMPLESFKKTVDYIRFARTYAMKPKVETVKTLESDKTPESPFTQQTFSVRTFRLEDIW